MKKLLLLMLIPAIAGGVLLGWSDETAEAGAWGGGDWMACRYDISEYGYITKARIYNYGPGRWFYLGIFSSKEMYYYDLLESRSPGWREYPINKSISYTYIYVGVKATVISSRYQLGVDTDLPHHRQYMYTAGFIGPTPPTSWGRWPRYEDLMIQIWVNKTTTNPTSLGRVKAFF
jgi:hypothetical protein